MQAPSLELERLSAIAVVSSYVRQLLLTNPAKALEMLEAGYDGQKFCFTLQERQMVLSIKTDTLQQFTIQLLAKIEEAEAGERLLE